MAKITQDSVVGIPLHQTLSYSETTKDNETYSVTRGGSVTTDMVAPPVPNGNPDTEHSVATYTDNVTTGQDNATITAQGNNVGTPDNLGNFYFLLTSASVNESASETTLRTSTYTDTKHTDNGGGNFTNDSVSVSSTSNGTDSFTLLEASHEDPTTNIMMVDSYDLSGNGTSTGPTNQSTHHDNQSQGSGHTDSGHVDTTSNKNDTVSYSFRTAGSISDNGWVNTAATATESGLETFTLTLNSYDNDSTWGIHSVSAADAGTDSFVFTQTGTAANATLGLSRSGTDAFSNSPNSGSDTFSVSQSAPAENGVIYSGSQAGSNASAWSYRYLNPDLTYGTENVSGIGFQWSTSPGGGVSVPFPTNQLHGATFASPVVGAADQAVTFASETVNAANNLTNGLLNPLQKTAYSVAKASADPFQSWTGFAETVVGFGRTANQTVLAGLAKRFTADARFFAVASQNPSVTGDPVTDTLNLTGGWLDTVTGSLTVSLRSWLGVGSLVDMRSGAYQTGQVLGQLTNAALMVFGGSLTGALGWAARSLQVANIAGQTVQGVEAVQNGDILGAVQAFANVALVAAWGTPACTQSSIVAWGLRTIHGVAAGQLVESSMGKFASGDWFGGFADLADAGANLYMMACFTGGMQVMTQRGWVRGSGRRRTTRWRRAMNTSRSAKLNSSASRPCSKRGLGFGTCMFTAKKFARRQNTPSTSGAKAGPPLRIYYPATGYAVTTGG